MMNHFFLDRRQDGQYTPKNQADGGAAAHSRGVLTRDLAIGSFPKSPDRQESAPDRISDNLIR